MQATEPTSPPVPAAPKPDSRYPHCQFCDGQASAITADPQPRIEPPAFAGEFFPASALFATVAPVHPAFQAGVFPSERTGVDARSAALFARHVMRC